MLGKLIVRTFALAASLGGMGLLVFVVSGGAKGNATKCEPHELTKIDNVERIFMERTNSYAFMYQAGSGEYKLGTLNASQTNQVTFIADVPKDKALWARTFGCESPSWESVLEIHVHQVRDVEGGGWNIGKGGSGTTVPIQ